MERECLTIFFFFGLKSTPCQNVPVEDIKTSLMAKQLHNSHSLLHPVLLVHFPCSRLSELSFKSTHLVVTPVLQFFQWICIEAHIVLARHTGSGSLAPAAPVFPGLFQPTDLSAVSGNALLLTLV